MNKQTKKTIKPEPTPLTQLSGKGLVMQAKIQGLAQETWSGQSNHKGGTDTEVWRNPGIQACTVGPVLIA